MTSLHADEAYLDHYRFSHDPFAARVPWFKFFPAQRKPVLGQLHHLARYSQLLLVVSGPEGSGKTLLRQALVASTNKQAVHSVVVSARGAGESGDLLRQVAQGLQMLQADVQAILAQIGQLALTGQEVYLLVDDAQHLSDAALASLLLLAEGEAGARAHVFLFARPELVPRLEALADGDECFHALELQPYSEGETRDYLALRLEGAGQGGELLSDEQVADIHERSGGWPGGINEAARELLTELMLAQRGRASRAGAGFALPRKHLLALVVVAIGVLAAWMMQGRSGGEVAQPTTTQLALDPQAPAPVVEAAPGAAAAVQEAEVPPIEFAGASQPLPLPLVGEAQPVIRQPLAQAAGAAAAEEGEEEVVAMEEVLESPGEALSAAPVAPPLPAPAPAATVAAKPPVAPAPAAASAAPKTPPVAPKVAPEPARPAAVGDWYAGQAASRYTLQVLGARAESSAQAFVRQHGAEYHYFMKRHQGQPLYVVTYGSFATREAAQAALGGLPAAVRAGKPWPRTFASIRQEIASAR